MKPTYDQIISVLKQWGSNTGEIKEIVQKLAEEDNTYILSAGVDVENSKNVIYYGLNLTKEGVELYTAWCQKHGHHAFLQGPVRNVLLFVDEYNTSVKATLEQWGIGA